MGHQDIEKLLEIKKWINEYQKDHKVKFAFIVDIDTQEGKTRIMINQKGTWYKEPSLTESQAKHYRKHEFEMFVPDLIDFKNKLIIEFQEEPIKRRGAYLAIKGHDEFSDEDKDLYYDLAKFTQLKYGSHQRTKRKICLNFSRHRQSI